MGIKIGNDWEADPQGYAIGFVEELTDKSTTLQNLIDDLNNYKKELNSSGENTKLNDKSIEILESMHTKLSALKEIIDSKKNSMEA